MSLKYFGTDGIRGKAYSKISLELSEKVGYSIKVLKTKNIVIGIDTRESSIDIKNALSKGALRAGINVFFAGVVSTPMIAHYSKKNNMVGIMITASHNLYEDNGIKFFNKGNKLTKEEELLIEDHIDNPIKNLRWSMGLYKEVNIFDEYLKLIKPLLIDNDLKLVYDSAHGANYKVVNEIFSKYFKNSHQIGNEPTGKNINLNCGATNLNYIKNYIKEKNYDLGVAFDGDGDRLMFVDSELNVYDGDFLIYIIANYLKEKKLLNNNSVVLTKMTNPGILNSLKEKDINYYLTDVGDKHVLRKMLEKNILVGGEQSGHIILSEYLNTGDGLLVALYILKILKETNQTLKELTEDIKLYPHKLINIENVNKNILNDKVFKNFIENILKDLEENDLFFIRPSGTEPVIRVTMSLKNKKKLNKYLKEVVTFIKERGKLFNE